MKTGPASDAQQTKQCVYNNRVLTYCGYRPSRRGHQLRVSSFHRREMCQRTKRCPRFKSSYKSLLYVIQNVYKQTILYWQLSSVDLHGLIWSGLLLYNLGSDVMENIYCCRFYLATDCISKNSISVDTCLLSRCLAADGF
jgi:hypothetical protein